MFILQFLVFWGERLLPGPFPSLKYKEIDYITCKRLYSLRPTTRVPTSNCPPPSPPPKKDPPPESKIWHTYNLGFL